MNEWIYLFLNSLNVYIEFGRYLFDEELQNILLNEMLNPKITKDAILMNLAIPTTFTLDLNFRH